MAALPNAGPANINHIRTELRDPRVLSAYHMKKLEVVLPTNTEDEDRVGDIANDVMINERSAFHYSNYHVW